MGCKESKQQLEEAEAKVGKRHRFLSFDSRVEAEWKAADKNGDGALSYKEIKAMLHKLNAMVPDRELKKQFKRFDKDGNNQLDLSEFKALFHSVQSFPDLREVFRLAAGGQEVMIAEELRRFLLESTNGETNWSLSECARNIMKSEGQSQAQIDAFLADRGDDEDQYLDGPELTIVGFTQMFANGNTNSVFNPKKVNQVYHDMTMPLSHYFISSSHNTYLNGNQLNSESTAKAVGRALRLGVRVIELDTWDGHDMVPMVNHGHTMCKPTTFESCIKEIAQTAFTTSEYPVILTIENHCSIPVQQRQAKMLHEVFGERLYRWEGILKKKSSSKESGGEMEKNWTLGPTEWASPEELKGKIVIRDKPKLKPKSQTTVYVEMNDSKQEAKVIDENEEEEEDEEDDEPGEIAVAPELLRIMYIKNVKLAPTILPNHSGVVYPEPKFRSSSSLSEKKMIKLSKPGSRARDLAAYASRHLVRCYPAGTRVDSSNYDPTPAWAAGAQIVALNYQTGSMPVWLNHGKFMDNGGCGFLLKPSALMKDPSPEARFTWDADTDSMIPRRLSVRIISGHYLPKPLGASEKSEVIDPYVELSVHGIGDSKQKQSTRTIQDNGFNPTWNETFKFSIYQPDLSLLAIIVKDRDVVTRDDFIGQCVVPINGLRTGYRVIPLLHENCAPQDHSYLFAQIQWENDDPNQAAPTIPEGEEA